MHRLNLSQIKTRLYRKPKDEIDRLRRWGPSAYFGIGKWKAEMEAAAWDLRPNFRPTSDAGKPVRVWFLTGKNFWYQTAFCAWTFQVHSRHLLQPMILDDGTLESESIRGLKRLFPNAEIVLREDSDQQFEKVFDRDNFPNIHWIRSKQLLFRKLTDIHAGSDCWRLFLDSDMLFFDRPNEIDAWLSRTDQCIAQRDCWESYGYSRDLVERLCGENLPRKINIGIFGLNGTMIDWEKVEFWLAQMFKTEGAKYNVTQCTVAMLMATQRLTVLDQEKFKVWPGTPDTLLKEAVLEHYVADSKPWYFGRAWKKALAV